MSKQTQVEDLIHRLYRDIGKEPADLVQVKPMDGGPDNALSYEVVRKDNKRARIYRRDIDDGNEQNIKASLMQFS